MKQNINNLLNDLLYKNDYNQTDLKINNIVNKLIIKNNFNNQYLLQNLFQDNKIINIENNINSKSYFLYGYPNKSELSYCSSTFNKKYNAMDKNTLNGFLGLLECLTVKNKLISINCNNKENKNILLANTISNILVNHLIMSYKNFLNNQEHNSKLFYKFITKEFKPPKILLTGYDNQEEINEICRTFFEINTWVGLRARIFIPSFHELFYSLNINLENNSEANNNSFELLTAKYNLTKMDLLLNELPNNFMFAAKNAFGNQEIEWNDIPAKIYENLICHETWFEIYSTYDVINKKRWFFPDINRKLIMYGYRHINEWLYINNWLNNKNDQLDIKNLNYIKPVITANLEQFVDLVDNGIWNNENKELEQFDYVIVDNADKMSTKYLPFLQYAFKNIIAIGEYENTNINKNNDAIKNIYKLINNQNNDINSLLTKLKLNQITDNQSVLNWINENTNIKTVEISNDKTESKKGICL